MIRRFETWDEVRAFFADAAPTREDDTPVLPGTGGRRATLEEILAYIEEHERRQGDAESSDPDPHPPHEGERQPGS